MVVNVCTATLTSTTRTVSITVTPANDTPQSAVGNTTVAEDGSVGIDLGALVSDIETSDANLTYTIVSGPARRADRLGSERDLHADRKYNAATSPTRSPIAVTPTTAAPSSLAFVPRLRPARRGAVSITVTPVNDTPSSSDTSTNVGEDGLVVIDLGAFVNDVETSDANLTYTIVSGPSHGGLTGAGQSKTYTPAANYNGTDSFTYSVTDRGDPDACGAVVVNVCTAALTSATRTVSITIDPADDAPVAVGDIKTVLEDAAATTIDVLANDTDIDGGPKTIASANQPAHGTVVVAGDNLSLTYKPAADYCNGGSPTDDFTYTLSGGSTASVRVTVTCVNDAPVVTLSGDFSNVDEGTTRIYTYTVTDVDSASPTVTESCGTGATRDDDALANHFSCTFIDGPGSTTVGVTADDGAAVNNLGSDTHDVTIKNVAPVISAVTATPDSVDEGGSATITVTASDAAGVADPLAYEFDCNGNGIFEVGPQASNSTTCSFPDGDATVPVGVRVTDGDGGIDTDSVDVDVLDVEPTIDNSAPGSIDEGSTFTLTLGAVHDPGQDTISSYSIDWGDGSAPTAGIGSPANTDPTHVYANGPEDWTITVTLTDEDGAHVGASRSVHVDDVAPTVTLAGDESVNEGSTHTYTFSVTDPGSADTFTVDTDFPKCGDDGEYVAASLSLTAGGGTFKCRFPDGPASTTLAIKVTDSDGVSGVDSEDVLIVAIANIAPTGTFSAESPVDEGSPATLSWTAVTDPSPTDTTAGFRYSFACDGLLTSLTGSYAAASTTSTVDCTFADDGDYSVLGRVSTRTTARRRPAPSFTWTTSRRWSMPALRPQRSPRVRSSHVPARSPTRAPTRGQRPSTTTTARVPSR